MREALQEKEDAKNMKAKMREKVNHNWNIMITSARCFSPILKYI